MTLPNRTHRSLARRGFSRVLKCLPGRRTLTALDAMPEQTSTQGRMNVHSTTLRTVTSRPAIPMERSSLMAQSSNAENPIATVVAEISSVFPACPQQYRQPGRDHIPRQCFAKSAHYQQCIVDAQAKAEHRRQILY